MKQHSLPGLPARPSRGDAVVVLGGSAGMSSRYRDVVEARGLSLRHYEARVPKKARRGGERVALVIVMVGMVSHALAAHANGLAAEGRVVYLRSASISALRAAVEREI